MGCFQKATIALIIALHLLSGLAKRENKHRRRDIEQLELLEGAENGRYKVVAKAEPYKNLPVISIVLIMVIGIERLQN